MLPDGVFSDLTSLVGLRLNGNALSSLDAGVFSGLTALVELTLTDNKLASLSAGGVLRSDVAENSQSGRKRPEYA